MLNTIAELSRRYGSDPAYVLAGGGNTSVKDAGSLWVKPSGVALSVIQPDDFVQMDRKLLRSCFDWKFDDPVLREDRIKKFMAYCVVKGDRRPSVEAPLHEVMPYRFVVHTHPALVNAMTCGVKGREIAAELFPDAMWVDYCDPGFSLAMTVIKAHAEYEKSRGVAPHLIFLQNHGVFVGADSVAEIDAVYRSVLDKLTDYCKKQGVSTEWSVPAADAACAMEFAPSLRGWLDAVVTASGAFGIPQGPLSPDHLVYAKAFGLVTETPTREAILEFQSKRGYMPRMVEIPGKAVFCCGKDKKAADTVRLLAENGAYIERVAAAFGGVHYLTDTQREFIENWEVESYRAKVASGGAAPLKGRVAVVTGGAQGFGYGIAKVLAAEGADVVIADMNAEGAKKAAAELGAGASGFAVNVADETSLENFFSELVISYGGVDLFVSNAGVVRSGSVKDFQLKDWKFVTDINYIGYFLCVKHCARLMAKQNAATGRWSDIVQVNSKSGLAGSKANGAYAGSKFGTIGLTQSFALELVNDHIKVNSVCPGNFFDGPLWSDPVKGLFVQYLAAGKVPGAQNTADVKKHYESLIPMHRGCTPADVALAIMYAVRQPYETGQAIPVTGGQVMLN